jgi:hypothetical protein
MDGPGADGEERDTDEPNDLQSVAAKKRARSAAEVDADGDIGGDISDHGERGSELEEENFAAPKKKREKSSAAADKIASLRSSVDDQYAELEEERREAETLVEENEEKRREAEEEEEEKSEELPETELAAREPGNQAEGLEEIFAKKRKTEEPDESAQPEPSPENTAERLAKKSPALQKFLERRKNKSNTKTTARAKAKAESGKESRTNSASAEKNAEAGSGAEEKAPVYLGIFVSISDSLNQLQSPAKVLGRVLKSFELSFDHCRAFIADINEEKQNASIRFDATGSAEPQNVPLESSLYQPIQAAGQEGEILGYLLLRPEAPREKFDAGEAAAVARAAPLLLAVLRATGESPEKERAA